MPTGKHWANFIFINLAFTIYIVGVFYIISIQEIKDNWPLYRCNPMYMPLSDQLDQDFVYCVQNIQMGFMEYLLQPINFVAASMTTVMAGFVEEIQGVRVMISSMRDMFGSITVNIFGVFSNLMTEFQKMILAMRDLMGKTIGTMVTLMYMMDGSVKTMSSMWNGPTGVVVKTLGKCFHPDTKLRLQNGKIVCIRDIEPGDNLENGSVVEATMRIKNNEKEPYYLVGDIYVTGSHSIKQNNMLFPPMNRFIKVRDFVGSAKTDLIDDIVYCLITNDHLIQIGEYTFWDWEDHLLS
jgi:hypothetical protein